MGKNIKHWLENLDKYDLVKHAKALKTRDIFLLCGLNDQDVLLEEHTLPLYRQIKSFNSGKVKMVVLDSDHSFNNVRDVITREIFEWVIKAE